ncbi:MAG: efflux RND transporter permease subunit, partial [Thermodesulfobacteriota bacterium]|nr:efflux RND transporter permease subunit [Thermodesulfobacteriota bacterium]
RAVTLSIVSPRDVPLEEAVEIVNRDVIGGLRKADLVPDNVELRLAGASDKLLATRAAISENLILAIVLSYLLMVAIFSHWGFPFIIMLTVPLGIGGGIFGLWLMNLVPGVNQPFDMITILGFLVLTGIVVNNPILLVEQARANIQNGMETVEAVVESTRARARPILMTTMTTIGGLSPLVFIPRAGTELYRGLGIVVLFGLMFSTLITLTFTPSLLSMLLQLRAWLAARRKPGIK